MRLNHPIHPLDRATMAEMRLIATSMKGSVTGPSAREAFDELMERTPAADNLTYEKGEVGGVHGWWCRPGEAAAADGALLYFHGDAYVAGSASAYQHFVGQLAARAKVAAFVPEYGLAPEHPFPAAVDGAQAAYRGSCGAGSYENRGGGRLRRRWFRSRASVVIGCPSAGGLRAASCRCGGDVTLDRLGAFRRQYGNAC